MNIVSTGQMRAQSFSIQVSTRERCNSRCKFCISRTTPNISHLHEEVQLCHMHRLKAGLGYAKQLGATHTILTGKADPTQEDDHYIHKLIQTARSYLPLVDFHTNGFLLQSKFDNSSLKSWLSLKELVQAGLTMITFSIAHHNPEKNKELMGISIDYKDIITRASELGLLVRASLVLCASGIWTFDDIYNYIIYMGSLGVHMVVLRELWNPGSEVSWTGKNQEVGAWNKQNFVSLERIQEYFDIHSSKIMPEKIYRRDPLPWGTPVYVVENAFKDIHHGVNVTFARCGEATKCPVMKSIVHKPDGHGYRNWDSNGDILY